MLSATRIMDVYTNMLAMHTSEYELYAQQDFLEQTLRLHHETEYIFATSLRASDLLRNVH